MSEDTIFGIVLFGVIGMVLVVIYFTVGQVISAAKFEAVCEYAGGTTQGDLCVKGDSVILRKDDYSK